MPADKKYPKNGTKRLLAVADLLEQDPSRWNQADWIDGVDDPQHAQHAECGTRACIAGHGVLLTPPDKIRKDASWAEAGAEAYDISDELAGAIFSGAYNPEDLPAVLRAIASVPVRNRTVRQFVLTVVRDTEGANLRSANLYNANLYGADLSGANLYGASLYSANLSYADLSYADLSGANLSYANLYNANLYNANLRSANLRSANLRSANLSYANLYNANLYNANLYNANLYNANLSGANLYGARGDSYTRLPAGYTVSPSGIVVKEN